MSVRLLGVIFLFLMSCSEGSKDVSLNKSEKKTTEGKTELNFIGHWLYQGKREDLVREMANEFEFTNQNYYVAFSFDNKFRFFGLGPN